MTKLQLQMGHNLYLRDPQETKLGRNIVSESVKMIDAVGFEKFTFKKLAEAISSTEASVYRYFENKHKMLIYLIGWYWNWVEYKIDFSIQNIECTERRLKIALKIIAEFKEQDPTFPEIDESALYRIVINESDKTYLTKQVDHDNREGLFHGFKNVCNKISGMVLDINPDYPYPNALVSTALEASHQQIFFSQHLPALTDLRSNDDELYRRNYEFLESIIFSSIQ